MLDGKGLLRPAIRDAVAIVRAAGVAVVIATGRSPWSAGAICLELGLLGPQITMNGGVFGSPVTGRTVWERRFSAPEVRDQLAFARSFGLRPLLCFLDGHAAENEAPGAESRALPEFAGGLRLRTVRSLERLAGDGPVRTYLQTAPEGHAVAVAAARARLGRGVSIVCSDDAGFELLRPGTNKGEALRAVANLLGVGIEETAAIGDAANDVEMLRIAGRSAAMRPAPAEVRAAASLVVPSSDEDGVLAALQAFLPALDLPEPERLRPALRPVAGLRIPDAFGAAKQRVARSGAAPQGATVRSA